MNRTVSTYQRSTTLLILFGAILLTACSPAPQPTAAETSTPAQAEQALPAEADTETPMEEAVTSLGEFALSSPVMEDGGRLPVDFTCEGEAVSPPLAWTGAPDGTAGYALAMDHVAGPGDTHWYWIVFNIPAETQSVEAGQTDFGSFGTNSVNPDLAYAPPCSQGGGDKLYTFTVYALSASPDLPYPAQVDLDTLLAAIEDITLGEANLDVFV